MPDLIVADISMPELNGIETIRELKSAGVDAKVVLSTVHEDPEYAIEALHAGALGYVVKHSASSELLPALEEALSGRMYVTPRVAKEDTMQGTGKDSSALLSVRPLPPGAAAGSRIPASQQR